MPVRPLKQFTDSQLKRDKEIGKGAFGTVYVGEAQGLKGKVVIKDQKVRSPDSIDEWRKEVEIMQKNRSPHIAEVLGYGQTAQILTIIMEFFPHGDLFCPLSFSSAPSYSLASSSSTAVLHKKRVPLNFIQRMRMARHCALGIKYLHVRFPSQPSFLPRLILVLGEQLHSPRY